MTTTIVNPSLMNLHNINLNYVRMFDRHKKTDLRQFFCERLQNTTSSLNLFEIQSISTTLSSEFLKRLTRKVTQLALRHDLANQSNQSKQCAINIYSLMLSEANKILSNPKSPLFSIKFDFAGKESKKLTESIMFILTLAGSQKLQLKQPNNFTIQLSWTDGSVFKKKIDHWLL